ncbi:hypothetical protein SDC9_154550 [bioreactor metagenome]|uniref:Uncharacterized protein n=1 Tax=bioreactor metagenome TaxID=1076179 RepID=A0A645F3U7_9ZZZZ
MKEFYKDYSQELTNVLNKKPAILPRLGNILILLSILCIIMLSNHISYPQYIEKDFYNISQSNREISGVIDYGFKENKIIKIGQSVILVKNSNNQELVNGRLTRLKISRKNMILTITPSSENIITEDNFKIKILIAQKKLLDNFWF